MIEYTDDDGQRVAIYEGRLSVYGEPSMRRDDGQVAVGVNLPDHWTAAIIAAQEAASA